MIYKLTEVASIQIGYQAPGRIEPDPDGTHRIIQAGDFADNGDILWETLTAMVPQREPSRYTLRDGDVLFLAKGTRRFALPIRNPDPHVIATSTFYLLRPCDEAVVLPEYLAWYLNVAAQDYLAAQAQRSTTIAFLAKDALENLEIELPPTSVQVTVARLDSLVRKERQLTALLLQKRASLMNALGKRMITGHIRSSHG